MGDGTGGVPRPLPTFVHYIYMEMYEQVVAIEGNGMVLDVDR